MSELLNTALEYLRAGLSVIVTGADKRPRTGDAPGYSWKPWQERLATEEEVRFWFAREKDASIALVGGAVSGHLEMIDFDIGAVWFERWKIQVLEDAPGLFEKLLIEQSQSGGKHVCYRNSEVVVGNKKLAMQPIEVLPLDKVETGKVYESGARKYRVNLSTANDGKVIYKVYFDDEKADKGNLVKQYDGKWVAVRCPIETRGEGGYFLCAPSARYTLLQGSFTELAVLTPAEREVLLSAARGLNKWHPKEQSEKRTGSERQLPVAPKGPRKAGDISPLDDWALRGDVRGLLESHGYTFCKRDAVRDYFTRPGKSDGSVSGDLVRESKVYKNFSSGDPYFERSGPGDKAYSPGEVFAQLECGGDLSAAAKKLLTMGFGTKRQGIASQFSAAELARFDQVDIPEGMSNEGEKENKIGATGGHAGGGTGVGSDDTRDGVDVDKERSAASGGAITGSGGSDGLRHGESELGVGSAVRIGGDNAVLKDPEKHKQVVAKKWLEEKFKDELHKVKQLTDVERDRAVMDLFGRLAVALQGTLKATYTRIRGDVMDALDYNKTEFESILREASAKREAHGGGEGDWASMARRFLNKLKGKDKGKPNAALKCWRDEWYLWKRAWGCYRRQSPKWVRSRMFTRFLMKCGIPISTRAVSDFAQAVEGLTIVDDDCEPGRWLKGVDGVVRRAGGRYLSMSNGILDLDSITFQFDCLSARPLIEHSPDFWQTFRLPYAFDPLKTFTGLEAALAQWQSWPEVLALLQDWAGYIFCPGQPLQRMLLSVGPGGDGKSQYLRIITALAGIENTSAVGLEGFDPGNQFGLWPMVNKLLNVIGDVNQVDRLGEGRLKSVVGGDRITVDRKKIEPVTVEIGAKLMANCNALPGFRDRSEGIWRRLLIVRWKSIPAGLVINDFADKLIAEEMSGIFNWALEGYVRVREAGFRITGVLEQWAEAARAEVQAEIEFFEECVETDGDVNSPNKLLTEELTEEYKNWCERNNQPKALYGRNLGGPLRRWLKTRKLPELKRNHDEIDAFLDETHDVQEKRFKQRKTSGQRKEFYRGIWLHALPIPSEGRQSSKNPLWSY